MILKHVHLVGFYSVLWLMMHGTMNVKKCHLIYRMYGNFFGRLGNGLVTKTDIYLENNWVMGSVGLL
jgi:hypothetical protein